MRPIWCILIALCLGSCNALIRKSDRSAAEIPDSIAIELFPDTVIANKLVEARFDMKLSNLGKAPYHYPLDPWLLHSDSEQRNWYVEILKNGVEYQGWKAYRIEVGTFNLKKRDIGKLEPGGAVAFNSNLTPAYYLESPATYAIRAVWDPFPQPKFGIRKITPAYSNWITVIVK